MWASRVVTIAATCASKAAKLLLSVAGVVSPNALACSRALVWEDVEPLISSKAEV